MELPLKSYLCLILIAYAANVGYGMPVSSWTEPLTNDGYGRPDFSSIEPLRIAGGYGRPDSSWTGPLISAGGNGIPDSSWKEPLRSAGGYGRPDSSWTGPIRSAGGNGRTDSSWKEPLRSPLFPLVVQDFVADVISRIYRDVPQIFTVPKISPDEIFSLFYNEVYKSNLRGGNPNPKFHALSKAQSIKENYDKINPQFLITVTSYTTGELLLQKGVLTAGNQKSLSNALADEFVNRSKYVEPSYQNYIISLHDGYASFLNSQGLATSSNIFVPAAVYVEVINALSKNYQIPSDVPNPQIEVYPNNFNSFIPNDGYLFRN